MKLGIIICALICLLALDAYGRSAMSPRHTGMEPPGRPKAIEALPGNSPSRTAEGGMGYVDAYGNTVSRDEAPPPKKEARRLRQGAFGGDRIEDAPAYLPDPEKRSASPWKF